ncbi:hypothetical protein [Anaerotignum lactatifermentans]|uniref:hypothetical protein n=1 Tax=Anaerotignum lactatifermentans TaxID=160404 RepID=UPI00267545C3|nr:hypothetical protein [Anaerotignum lactatifermentans]
MAGGFDKNKDYAAAIKNEKDPGKRNQLISERQNKINWMNSTGQNKNGYSNSIYGSKYSTISEKGGSSGGGSRGGGWGGYSEPDYAAIAAEARREANMAATFASMNAAKIGMDNAAMEAAMKNTNDTYSGFNKATVDNTRSESAINPAAYTFRNFDPNRDYAAEIAKETDPAKRAQLKQERQNKIDWMNGAGTNKGYTNDIYKDDERKEAKYTPYFQDYTQGWDWNGIRKGARADLNNRAYDIINAMRINSAAYAGADPATRKQLAAENQAYADQLNTLGIAVRQFEPGGSWYYTGRPVLKGDPYETETGYYKLYDVPENYDMFVNNNPYEELLYDKDPKTEAEYGDGGAWGDWFMNAADMQAGAVDAQLKALQAKLELQKGENNSYYDDIAAQAYVAKRQAEAAMPQRLAAYGISGGGSESAQLGLDTSYQNNINANELARQNMLQQLDYQNILAQSQANSDKANIYAQAQKDAYNAFLQQQQWEQQQKQWQWEQDTWLKEFDLKRTELENSLRYQMTNEDWKRRQFEIDLALEMHDLDKLESMGYDVGYLRQQDAYEAAQQALKMSKTSSSRSSGSSSRSRSTYSSGGNTGSGGAVNAAAADKDSLGRITSLYRMAMTSPFQSEDEKAAFFENQVAREIQNGNISKEAFDYWNKTQVIGVAGMR